MNTQINWKTSVLQSALHAADLVLQGRNLVDPALQQALLEPALALQDEVVAECLPVAPFWRHLVAWSAEYSQTRELAQTALIKLLGRNERSERLADKLAGLVSDVSHAIEKCLPKLAEELPLRIGPLREQWESRGPGMLRQIGQLTDEDLIPEAATVVIIHPVSAGGGVAYLPANQIRLEGMLANPLADLPEIVRLAWLLGQVQMELPKFSENIATERLVQLAPLALLPATLAAAERVELVRSATEILPRALAAWNNFPSNDLAGSETETALLIAQWWSEYQASRPEWSVALLALDAMLPRIGEPTA